MSGQFIRIKAAEGYLDSDVRIDAIIMLSDDGKRGTRVSMSNGVYLPTPERIEHLKDRIERMS